MAQGLVESGQSNATKPLTSRTSPLEVLITLGVGARMALARQRSSSPTSLNRPTRGTNVPQPAEVRKPIFLIIPTSAANCPFCVVLEE